MSLTRISITSWRQHGDDECGISTALYGADDTTVQLDEIKLDHEIGLDEDGKLFPEDYDAEAEQDWKNVIYVNGEVEISDGDVMEHKGRKFQISIKEIT